MSRQKPTLPKNRQPCDLPNPISTSSFWHTQPSPLLTAHRSTRNLPTSADVVVIGSGITGASVAHHLLQKIDGKKEGLNVVMLEAREACWGATGRNGGHCQPLLFEFPEDLAVGRFELSNFVTLETMIKDKSIDCEFVAQPGVRAIYSAHHYQEAVEAIKTLGRTAPELASMMKVVTDKDELAKFRIPTATGAVVTSVAARLWPYKFVARVLEDLLTSSDMPGTFNLQTHTPAESITQHSQDNWTIKTPRGSITAQKVVLATNAYTSHLLPAFSDLIVPCRGQMSAQNPPFSLAGDNRLKTSLGFLGDGLDDYLIQRPSEAGGHLMFGGGRQHGPSIGVTDDSVLDAETAKYLRTRLTDVLALPDTKEMTPAREWTGIMGFSRDERPWVGPVPGKQGVYLAAGYTGHGMPNTWLSGKAVALMVQAETEGVAQGEATALAVEKTGLPKAYLLTEQRVQKAMACEDVEAHDWSEMERARRTS